MAFLLFLLVNRWKKSDFFFFNVSQSVGIALGIVLGPLASQALLQTRLFSLSWLSWWTCLTMGPSGSGHATRMPGGRSRCFEPVGSGGEPSQPSEMKDVFEIILLTSSSFQFSILHIQTVHGVPQLCPQ